jgi:hydrogenase maturation protease
MNAVRQSQILLLALGNDILGDDGVGFLAARALRDELDGIVDVVESGEAGLALLEMIEGYEHALLLDSMVTGRQAPGTVVEMSAGDFRSVVAPSPHYAGLPEVFELARRLGVTVPQHIAVLAMEVEDPYTIREELTPAVQAALPEYVARAREILMRWSAKCTNTR